MMLLLGDLHLLCVLESGACIHTMHVLLVMDFISLVSNRHAVCGFQLTAKCVHMTKQSSQLWYKAPRCDVI